MARILSPKEFSELVETTLPPFKRFATSAEVKDREVLIDLIERARPFCTCEIDTHDKEANEVVSDFLSALAVEDIDLAAACVTYMETRVRAQFKRS